MLLWLLFTQLIFSVLTWLAYQTVHIVPTWTKIAGFLPLTIPLFLFIQIIFLFVWLFRKSIWAVVPAFTLFLGFPFLHSLYPFRFFQASKINCEGDKTIKVLSYNVYVFGAFQDNSQAKNIINYLRDSGADIICIQEFYNKKNSNDFDILKSMKINYPYQFVTPYLKGRYGDSFGMCILSKYPLSQTETIRFTNKTKNHALYAQVNIHGKAISLYNVHLQSMAIDQQKIKDGIWDTEKGKNFITILKKFKQGSAQRSHQVRQILEHQKKYADLPTLICGDLNDIPLSYTYQQFKNGFQNGHEERGIGWGSTFAGAFPLLRIDHIFASKHFTFIDFKTDHAVNFSDHYPILAQVWLP